MCDLFVCVCLRALVYYVVVLLSCGVCVCVSLLVVLVIGVFVCCLCAC